MEVWKTITWSGSSKWQQFSNYREPEVLKVKRTKSVLLNIYVKCDISKSKKFYMITPLI